MGSAAVRFKTAHAKPTSPPTAWCNRAHRGNFLAVSYCCAGRRLLNAMGGKWWYSVMYITRVEFDTVTYDGSQGVSWGAVKLTTQTGTIVLHCSAAHADDASRQDILNLMLD